MYFKSQKIEQCAIVFMYVLQTSLLKSAINSSLVNSWQR